MKDKAPSYKKAKVASGIGETARTIIYAVLIAVFIRTFAYEPFNIPSGSMVPTLLIGDYLFVSKFSYGYSRYSLPFGLPLISGRIFYHLPQRGDVVVFKLPSDNSTDYIKRVIGLPGDRIQITNGTVYVNDVPVKRVRIENYIEREGGRSEPREQYRETLPDNHGSFDSGRSHPILLFNPTGTVENTGVFTVPPEHFFMMGDNRDNSSDSRVNGSGVGMVPKENLVGRAEFIFFSTDGSADWWQVWKWPFAIRYSRLFKAIDSDDGKGS